MDQAERFAKESYAKRLQVGALLVKDDNVISHGWNGTPSGWDNECEEDNVTRPEVFHAEENLILKLTKNGGVGSNGATMFVTHQPCMNCSRMIFRSGVTTVYYKHPYRDDSGVKFLDKCGVKVIQYDNDNKD